MSKFRVNESEVKFAFSLVSEKCLRISMLPKDEMVSRVFSTLDLDDRDWGEPAVSVDGTSGKESISISTFSVELCAEDFGIRILKNNREVQNLRFCAETGTVTFPLGNGPLFGLGHGYKKHIDRRGGVYDLKVNGQVRGIIETYSATSPTPMVISTEGWALFFHQPWKSTISLEGENGAFIKNPREPLEYCDIFVIAADEPADAAREYYRFTGLPPMPPKYAFGYQQSYRTLVHNGVNYVKKTAQYMRDKGIPCDLLVYLGTGYCDYGWNVENGNFAFHPDVFPDPVETMKELHELNYKVMLHVTRCYTGLHGTIADKDVSPMEYDHARNYWDKHTKLHAVAQNEAWWPDDADEVDMRERLARWRMYYEGQLEHDPNTRPFQMQRNTFPGANKYGGIIWSGDVNAQWETLKNQVPVGLNASLSASPYWGSDTGGFFSTPEFDGELFMRWFAYSVFTPFVRAHGRPSFLHNPWGFTMFKNLDEIPPEAAPGVKNAGQPDPNILPDHRVEPFCKEMLRVRYELLPYIYNLAYETRQGIPMMRPLWYAFPDDPKAVEMGSQYMLGASLMVAPVTEKGAENWDVYFPNGDWYCFWDGTKIEGGGVKTVPAPLVRIPVFVRAGGIVAKAPAVQYVETAKKDDFDALELLIYKGANGKYHLYEDDGISMDYLDGKCTTTEFFWDDAEQKLSAEGISSIFPGKRREVKAVVMPEGREILLSVDYQDR